MGQKPFPNRGKLGFIVAQLIEGTPEEQIQDALEQYGPGGRVALGEHGAYGHVGDRTLSNIKKVFLVSKELLEPRFVRLNDPSIQEAKSRHLAELRNTIEGWRQGLVTPSIDCVSREAHRPIGEMAPELLNCLKEHLPYQELWAASDAHEHSLGLFARSIKSAETAIVKTVRGWDEVGEVSGVACTPIMGRVAELLRGSQDPLPRFEAHPAKGGGQWLSIGGYDLARTANVDLTREKYLQYCLKLARSKRLKTITRLSAQTLKLEAELRQCLDFALLGQRWVFHSCRQCPDVGGSVCNGLGPGSQGNSQT